MKIFFQLKLTSNKRLSLKQWIKNGLASDWTTWVENRDNIIEIEDFSQALYLIYQLYSTGTAKNYIWHVVNYVRGLVQIYVRRVNAEDIFYLTNQQTQYTLILPILLNNYLPYLFKQGYTIREIAKRTGISKSSIHRELQVLMED